MVSSACNALMQDALIMAGTALGGVLNGILLAQSLQTALKNGQTDGGVLIAQST